VVSSRAPAKVDSGEPAARDRLKITLKKGTYHILCEPHKSVGMVLTIRVK
jgi:plastocyanin